MCPFDAINIIYFKTMFVVSNSNNEQQCMTSGILLRGMTWRYDMEI